MSEIYESKERPTPYPTAWAVRCPCCETEMEFEVQEDDSGAFGFDAANIPVCEPCSVMFFPETVQVRIVTECTTCGGTGKEGRHSICRDCDETPAPQTQEAAPRYVPIGFQWRGRLSADDLWSPWRDGPCPAVIPKGSEAEERRVYVLAATEGFDRG